MVRLTIRRGRGNPLGPESKHYLGSKTQPRKSRKGNCKVGGWWSTLTVSLRLKLLERGVEEKHFVQEFIVQLFRHGICQKFYTPRFSG